MPGCRSTNPSGLHLRCRCSCPRVLERETKERETNGWNDSRNVRGPGFLTNGRIVNAGLSHRRLGEEDPGLVSFFGFEILKDMQLKISRGCAVRALAVVDGASLVFDLRLFRSAELLRLCTNCRAADLRILPSSHVLPFCSFASFRLPLPIRVKGRKRRLEIAQPVGAQ